MPIYDYACTNCRQVTEVIHGIDAPGPRFCPACGAEGTMRKAFAPPTVHFKGSGWAKKDRSALRATRSRPATDGGESADTKPASGEAAATTTKAGDATSSSTPGDSGGSSKPSVARDSGKGTSSASSAES